MSFTNHQTINIERMVVFCIGDCRLQDFLNIIGDTPTREAQCGERLGCILTADQTSDLVQLLRADAQVAENSASLIIRQ